MGSPSHVVFYLRQLCVQFAGLGGLDQVPAPTPRSSHGLPFRACEDRFLIPTSVERTPTQPFCPKVIVERITRADQGPNQTREAQIHLTALCRPLGRNDFASCYENQSEIGQWPTTNWPNTLRQSPIHHSHRRALPGFTGKSPSIVGGTRRSKRHPARLDLGAIFGIKSHSLTNHHHFHPSDTYASCITLNNSWLICLRIRAKGRKGNRWSCIFRMVNCSSVVNERYRR